MLNRTIGAAVTVFALGGTAAACPDGQSSGAFGFCYPNIGGEVGRVWEKGKTELNNLKNDFEKWRETGVCGGDICDIFAAAIEFGKDQVTDFGQSLENARERLEEGKPLDAVWHLHTDYLNNTQENAADAAMRSRVLMATGQVGAAVYGGPQGAAGYTAWLTYNQTKDLGSAVKAGLISGVTSAALSGVSEIDMSGSEGIIARSALTGAINGAAVAASGGTEEEIRAAVGMGAVTVLIREGYKKLTRLELDRDRLRSSTGEAYCLLAVPTVEYVQSGGTHKCWGPPSAYKIENGKVLLNDDGKTPAIDYKALNPDRPHVGMWADADTKYNIAAENHGFMVGVSRAPGWNAMAVAHDELSIQAKFDLLPLRAGIVPTVLSIPPAVVATYLGTGNQIHETIRENFVRGQRGDEPGLPPPASGEVQTPKPKPVKIAFDPNDPGPTESLHVFCGKESGGEELAKRTDILVSVAADSKSRGRDRRVCRILQRTKGLYFELGHAHHEINYCHKQAERIARNRQRQGHLCFANTGIRMGETAKVEGAVR